MGSVDNPADWRYVDFMKMAVPLLMIGLGVLAGQSLGSVVMNNHNYYPNNQATATGRILNLGRNSVEIYDEYRKRRETYIDVDRHIPFEKGDHVRVFFNPCTNVVVLIKRMPSLPYNPSGQNLGYISRS